MKRQRSFSSKLPLFVFLLILFVFVHGSSGAGQPTPVTDAGKDSLESVHGLLAGLSDEQVRQMLIQELQKDLAPPPQSSSLGNRVDGPGAPLSRLLRSFNTSSGDYEHQFHELLAWIPHIPPDFYKVFISL